MKPLAKIRKHCLSKPGALEDEPWPGDIAWKVRGKIFAMYGGDCVTVKSTLEKQAALVMHPAISKAAYVGRFGWVTIDPKDSDTVDLTLDLIDESYDSITSPKKSSKGRPREQPAGRRKALMRAERPRSQSAATKKKK